MNTRTKNIRHLASKFSNKEFRDLYVDSHITNGVSFQIRGMRKGRKWSQKKLATEIGTQQEAISRLENPDYGRFSLDTLKKVAAVFDVALLVRFIPFSELAARTTSMTRRTIDVPSYSEDDGLNEYNSSAITSIDAPKVKTDYPNMIRTDNTSFSAVATHG